MITKVIGKRILLSPTNEEVKSKSGLNLSAGEPSKYKNAIVAHVGTDVALINVGDKVQYDSAPTHTTRIDGVLYVVALERDIFVVF